MDKLKIINFMVKICIVAIVCVVLFTDKRSKNIVKIKSETEKYFSQQGAQVIVTDQMFIPFRSDMPEWIDLTFKRDSIYSVLKIFKENNLEKLSLNVNGIKKDIYLYSIKFPLKLKFSQDYLTVNISKIEHINKYVFFEKDIKYQYHKNTDGTYLVLDKKQNQVFLKKNQVNILK